MIPRLGHQRSVAVVFLLSSAAIVFYIVATQDNTKHRLSHFQGNAIRRGKYRTDRNDTFNVYRDFVAHSKGAEGAGPRNRSLSKLKVFIVPFSHADPGWLRTFDSYTQDTDSTLNNMHQFLTANQNMTFIWTELAFFERWWSKQNSSTRDDVRRLIKSGRLEMTTGSWVMTDEAAVYYPLSVDNIVEGHQFLKEALGNISSKKTERE
ncbi:glycosyl hydrolase family 38 protein [Oesophagostomum dentatum]|uniref:Glycosyl hydrolase family 38 protein n=1 Tax=Oesophagostomum dentatum TaxID=61180 RepID=A0A0B1TDL0_OESDE|nr:glycosyl hydrolase family 38 protein [Oesophagostomum dentatum]